MPVLRRHLDELLALGLSVLLVAEVLMLVRTGTGPALGAALLGGGALALRRRAPLVGFLGAVAGLAALLVLAPQLDGESVGFIAVYFIAHYSLGRWAYGLRAWIGVACVAASMTLFAVGDATTNDVALADISLGSIAFAIVFVGGPWAAGVAMRLREARLATLDEENRRLQAEQEESARRAVAEERARIARELHDVVSHPISVTVLQARGARAMLGRDEKAVRRALDASRRPTPPR